MMTDGEASLIANDEAYDWGKDRIVETTIPIDPCSTSSSPAGATSSTRGEPDRLLREPELRGHRCRLRASQGAVLRVPG